MYLSSSGGPSQWSSMRTGQVAMIRRIIVDKDDLLRTVWSMLMIWRCVDECDQLPSSTRHCETFTTPLPPGLYHLVAFFKGCCHEQGSAFGT